MDSERNSDMKTVKIRETVIGEGMPKICVPITGTAAAGILEEAAFASALRADVAEWRADWFDSISDPEEVTSILKALRSTLGGIPLLMTVRTLPEGGQIDITDDDYAGLCEHAVSTGLIDLIDVELSKGNRIVREIIDSAHSNGVSVIGSSHDFEKTPGRETIIDRLCRMQELGADILKIAVMPRSRKDVITLMDAAEKMTREYADHPVVAISMGSAGVITRIACESFGSAMTFGAAQSVSAPGQIGVSELREILAVLHSAL